MFSLPGYRHYTRCGLRQAGPPHWNVYTRARIDDPPNSQGVGAGFHPGWLLAQATDLLRRTGCLSRILLLGTCSCGKVGPVVAAELPGVGKVVVSVVSSR